MQVDINDSREVCLFWARCGAKGHADRLTRYPYDPAKEGKEFLATFEEAFLVHINREPIAPQHAKSLSDFFVTCQKAKDIVLRLYESGFVKISLLLSLRSAYSYQSLGIDPTKLTTDAIQKGDVPDEVHIGDLHPFSRMIDQSIFLVESVDDSLTEIWRQEKHLYCCQECNSIFITYRNKPQQYCSHRCGNRVSQRKRQRKSNM
jgi:hypothetical protein